MLVREGVLGNQPHHRHGHGDHPLQRGGRSLGRVVAAVLLHGSGGPGATGWSNFKTNIPVLSEHFQSYAGHARLGAGRTPSAHDAVTTPRRPSSCSTPSASRRPRSSATRWAGSRRCAWPPSTPRGSATSSPWGRGRTRSPSSSPAGGLSEGMKVLLGATRTRAGDDDGAHRGDDLRLGALRDRRARPGTGRRDARQPRPRAQLPRGLRRGSGRSPSGSGLEDLRDRDPDAAHPRPGRPGRALRELAHPARTHPELGASCC